MTEVNEEQEVSEDHHVVFMTNGMVAWCLSSLGWLSDAHEISCEATEPCLARRLWSPMWVWRMVENHRIPIDAAMLATMSYYKPETDELESLPSCCIKRSLQWLQQGENVNRKWAHEFDCAVIIPKDASTLARNKRETNVELNSRMPCRQIR